MAGERIDYTAAAVEAARSVLIELTHILGEYRDDMVSLDEEERTIRQRDAFERANLLLHQLGIA